MLGISSTTPKLTASRNTHRKKTQKAQSLDSSDDFLAAGVELEEAAEKWRAGDALKSSRFYSRALQVYEQGLIKFPQSFDLAYNRARAKFTITQYPDLVEEQAPIKLEALLQSALESHRYALHLNSHNADTLFNTAQVLTTLAELLSTKLTTANTARSYADEGRQLFQRCLQIQEFELAQSLLITSGTVWDKKASHENAVKQDTDLESSHLQEESEQWALMEYPTTKQSILDTIVAFLEAIELSCHLILPMETMNLDELKLHAKSLIEKKEALTCEENREQAQNYRHDLIVKLQSTFLDTEFRLELISAATYDEALKALLLKYSADVGSKIGSSLLQCELAEACIAFSNSVEGVAGYSSARWSRLTKALDLLEKAAKSPDAKNIASIHSLRGDVEMLRYRLSFSSELPTSITGPTVRQRLIRNAETYYRGASGWIDSSATRTEMWQERTREAVAASIADASPDRIHSLLRVGASLLTVSQVLEEMLDDSLITREMVNSAQLHLFCSTEQAL